MSSGYTYDSGTGVLDKASIREYTIRSLGKVGERENATWVGIGDIDDFKDINDSYGHAYGDKVLRLVADTFRRHLGGWGEIGRFGGDEFFFCINDADEETVRNIFRLSRVEIGQKTAPEMAGNVGVTMTIGAVAAPENGTDYDTLFDKADKALYIGKGKGKNRYILYREEMHGDIVVPKSQTKIRYVQDYTLRLAECVNKCMDKLLLEGPSNLGKTMDVLMDTMSADFIAFYFGKTKLGTWLPEDAGSLAQAAADEQKKKAVIRDGAPPDFDRDILKEVKASTDGFATGLLVINNVNLRRTECPVTADWMDANHLREAIIYAPRRKNGRKAPVFVVASAKQKKWAAEDPHYLMIYANIVCCLIERKEIQFLD